MKQVVLEAQVRDVKKNLNTIRKAGQVPAVFYGKKEQPIAISVDAKKFMSIIEKEGANVIVELKFKNSSKPSIVKDLQRHILTQAPNHIDFQSISLTEKIEILVPIHVEGVADGVKNEGGTLEHVMREIKVRCLPTDMPSKISVDVTALKVGDDITVEQLPKIEGVEYIHHDKSAVVVTVLGQTVEEEKPAEATAKPQAPEIISKGKKEEEGAADGAKK